MSSSSSSESSSSSSSPEPAPPPRKVPNSKQKSRNQASTPLPQNFANYINHIRLQFLFIHFFLQKSSSFKDLFFSQTRRRAELSLNYRERKSRDPFRHTRNKRRRTGELIISEKYNVSLP